MTNFLAHKKNRFYIVSVRKLGERRFVVVVKVGKFSRGMPTILNEMVRKKTFFTFAGAKNRVLDIFNKRLKAGYADMLSRDYKGGQALISNLNQFLEATIEDGEETVQSVTETDTVSDTVSETESVPVKESAKRGRRPRNVNMDNLVEAECIKNDGVQSQFTLGATYMVNPDGDGSDSRFIYAYDKLGTRRTVFADRFKIVQTV